MPKSSPTSIAQAPRPTQIPSRPYIVLHNYFFLPLDLAFEPAAFELEDATLDALDGDVELALLPVADLNLSSGLFCAWC